MHPRMNATIDFRVEPCVSMRTQRHPYRAATGAGIVSFVNRGII